MNPRTPSRHPHLTTLPLAGLVLLEMLFPLKAAAVALGSLDVRSHLGEAFRGTIALRIDDSEFIDQCLTLERNPGGDTGVPFLNGARLSVEKSGKGMHLLITTAGPVNEPVVRLQVQANCTGTRVAREYTVLLDPAPARPEQATPLLVPAVPVAVAAPKPAAAPVNVSPQPVPPGVDMVVKPGDNLRAIARRASATPDNPADVERLMKAIVKANPQILTAGNSVRLQLGQVLRVPQGGATSSPTSGKPAPTEAPAPKPAVVNKAATPPAPPAAKPAPAAPAKEEFRVSLSAPGDAAKAGTKPGAADTPQEQKLQQIEQELNLKSDDQTASILALSNQLKQMEARVGEMQKALSKANAELIQVRNAPPPKDDSLMWVGIGAAGTLLTGLLGFLGMRFREPLLERLARRKEQSLLPPAPTPAATEAAPAPLVSDAPTAATPPVEDELDDVPSAFGKSAISVSYDHSLLDEADLYISSGRTKEAIDLLESHLDNSEQDSKPWLMLFALYFTDSLKDNFNNLAQRFHAAVQDDDAWERVQTLGRQLDPDNILYLSAQSAESAPAPQDDDMDFLESAPPVVSLDTLLEEPAAPALDLPLDSAPEQAVSLDLPLEDLQAGMPPATLDFPLDAAPAPASEDGIVEISLDFPLDTPAPVAQPAPPPVAEEDVEILLDIAAPPPAAEPEPLEISLDIPLEPVPDTAPAASAEEELLLPALETSPAAPSAPVADEAPPEISLDIPLEFAVLEVPAPATEEAELVLEMPALDFDSQASPAVAPAAPPLPAEPEELLIDLPTLPDLPTDNNAPR